MWQGGLFSVVAVEIRDRTALEEGITNGEQIERTDLWIVVAYSEGSLSSAYISSV